MIPANDNNNPARHAGIILRHVLKGKPDAHPRINAGLVYARTSDPAEREATLAIAGGEVAAVARVVLREGKDLTQAGLALGP